MAVWFKNGRKYSAMPKLTNLVDYGKTWWSWWRGLQPKWRLLPDGTLAREGPDTIVDWEKTCRGGTNGFFVIVLTLSWWVDALDGRVDDEELLGALDEVMWVVDCMIKSCGAAGGPGGEKHSLEDKISEVPAKKRYVRQFRHTAGADRTTWLFRKTK